MGLGVGRGRRKAGRGTDFSDSEQAREEEKQRARKEEERLPESWETRAGRLSAWLEGDYILTENLEVRPRDQPWQ